MSTDKNVEDIHIGFAHVDQHLLYWKMHVQAAKDRAAQLGVKLSPVPVNTLAEQVSVVKDFIAQKVDALIIGPIDGTHPDLISATKQALAANIPVVATSTNIVDVPVTWVGADTFKGAALAAAYLVDRLGGEGQVALIASPETLPRVEGFREVMRDHPACPIVFEAKGDWSYETGAQLMQAALAAAPDVRAVYAANDPMALGAVTTIAEAGRSGEIAVVGCDGLPEAFIAIYQETMVATINQNPSAVGRLTLEAALRVLRGEAVPPSILVEAELITRDTLTPASMDLLELLPRVLNSLVESNNRQQRLQEEYTTRLKQEAAEQERLQQEIIEGQRQAIQELSTPVIPVWAGVIVVPLIGHIDTLRARDITRVLLAGISQHQAKVVILDITGVPIVDSGVAAYLYKTIQAARLKGARTIITGISEAVAETIVDLGIDWGGIETLTDLQSGLRAVLRGSSI